MVSSCPTQPVPCIAHSAAGLNHAIYNWVFLEKIFLKEIICFKQRKLQAVSQQNFDLWTFASMTNLIFSFKNLSRKLLAGTNFLEEQWQYFLKFYNSKDLF